MLDDYSFALCLTHDVDRPYKRVPQALYHTIRDTSLDHLAAVSPEHNPYWQFESIMSLEDDLGVRSAFYFLDEPPIYDKNPNAWGQPVQWVQQFGRYRVTSPELLAVVDALDEGGWEIGLHGSYNSYDDRERLREEKRKIESAVGHPIRGGRQHYLRLEVPDTWRHHEEIGLQYDASLGSSTDYGFQHGYRPFRPFDTEFVVFPLTAMEVTFPDPGNAFEQAWQTCLTLLSEAAEHRAVMTVLWHPRFFSETDFPGYRRLYRQLIGHALELGAWVGPPGDLYERLTSTGQLEEIARPSHHRERTPFDSEPADVDRGNTHAQQAYREGNSR